MKKTIQHYLGIAILVLIPIWFIFNTFFAPKASSHERISEVKQAITEQQDAYQYYAPLARQGKLAEQQMGLASQKANLLRQELKELEGFQSGE